MLTRSNFESPPTENIPKLTKYKASVDYVAPLTYQNSLENHDNCFLGISLENHNFREAKLEAMLIWISKRFKKCTILIGDSIHRLTLESTTQLTPENALSEAIKMGKEFIIKNQSLFDKYSPLTHFTLLTCEEVQTWESYLEHHEQLQQLFHQNSDFRTSIESFGKTYHQKKSAELMQEEWERRMSFSSRYFLEEFAIFACLKRQGNPIIVYPGSLNTLVEIVNGSHPKASDDLKQLIIVSLMIRGK